jgi:hypothetical protein
MRLEMYDKFGFTTTDKNLVNISYLENHTENFKRRTNEDGNTYYQCKVRNLFFTMSDYRVRIVGSPATFLHGHNFNTLKYHEIDRFSHEVSEAFGVDITRFKIYMMDITDNLFMDYKPIIYKRYMAETRYFNRIGYKHNGLYYRNKQHQLLFYDKTIQAKQERVPIPKEFINRNIWRYEYSIFRKVHKKLGTPLIGINDLADSDYYVSTVNAWEKMFNSLNLVDVDVREMVYRPGMTRDDYLILSGVMANGGLGTVYDDLDEDVKMERIDYHAAHRRKKKYMKVVEDYKQLCGNPPDLKEELIRRVKEKAEENRMLVRT